MKLILGDCLEKLKDLPDNSVDSVVTDPPYGLSFMGKKWDYDVPSVEIWKECLRVLKPGGHLLSFSGSRTYHRMAVRIEDAGFEIRDQIMWIYGSGFPKGKSQLKPAHEPIVMARKPGPIQPLNIDDCRIEYKDDKPQSVPTNRDLDKASGWAQELKRTEDWVPNNTGRWPANVIFDEGEEPWRKYFYCPKVSKKERNEGMEQEVGTFITRPRREDGSVIYKETHPEEWSEAMSKLTRKDKSPKAAAEEKLQNDNGGLKNTHPTVKPTDLMLHLIKLVTPKGGLVLEPFMGSGSTGKAAVRGGYDFIGIEREEEYYKISKARIEDENRVCNTNI